MFQAFCAFVIFRDSLCDPVLTKKSIFLDRACSIGIDCGYSRFADVLNLNFSQKNTLPPVM